MHRYIRPLREGEIVAINERGHVYSFDPRTTGVERGEISKRLAGIDAGTLMSVSDTREAMREAGRAAAAQERREARERAQPLTRIEERIIDCQQQAERGFDVERDGEHVHLTGGKAFAAALDQAGIAVVRVTERDIGALEALRRDEELARLAAETNVEARRSGRFAVLEVGDIAAVDRAGNVHRLNPYKLDLTRIENQLVEAGGERLASVTEARAEFETERIALAAFREELMQARMERAGDISHEPAAAGRDVAEPDIQEPESVLGNMMDKAIGAALDFAADFLAPPPPPTPDQAERMVRGAEEKQVEAEARRERDTRLAETVEMARAATRAEAERQEQEHARTRQRERDEELGRDR